MFFFIRTFSFLFLSLCDEIHVYRSNSNRWYYSNEYPFICWTWKWCINGYYLEFPFWRLGQSCLTTIPTLPRFRCMSYPAYKQRWLLGTPRLAYCAEKLKQSKSNFYINIYHNSFPNPMYLKIIYQTIHWE